MRTLIRNLRTTEQGYSFSLQNEGGSTACSYRMIRLSDKQPFYSVLYFNGAAWHGVHRDGAPLHIPAAFNTWSERRQRAYLRQNVLPPALRGKD